MLTVIFLSIATILAIAGAVGCGALYFNGRRHLARIRAEISENSNAASEKTGQLTAELEKLNQRLETVEGRKTSLWDWTPEPTSVNLNRRGQVLRLYRRGDSAHEIASTLGLSQGEVALIVKVHELSRTKPEPQNFSDEAAFLSEPKINFKRPSNFS